MTIEKKKSKHIGILVTIFTILSMLLILGLRDYFIEGKTNVLNLDLSDKQESSSEQTSTKPTNIPLQTTDTEVADTDINTTIIRVDVGDELTENEQVKVNKTIFDQNTENIYITAYMNLIEPGEIVSAILFVDKTQQSIGPAVTRIEKEGETITSFAFYKPDSGWPIGEYKLTVSLSSGQEKSLDFLIEE
ncbi:hypothetical protein KKG46_00550 [Patescibacteria group bacterium]|nr:hypothetical protein [Patescibacteria group bacterium]